MNETLKEIYDNFYKPAVRKELLDECDYCRSELLKSMEPWQQNLFLRFVELKDTGYDRCSLDSFICGFKLAWKMTNELAIYKNERPRLVDTDRPDAR